MLRSVSRAALVILVLSPCADARWRRRGGSSYSYQSVESVSYVQPTAAATETTTTAIVSIKAESSDDALDEVNALRVQRGLRPFVRDRLLTIGAANVARFRAERLMAGHTASDFAGLPDGASATAAGCAAWEPSWGFGACCIFGDYRVAGAAWVRGRDGRNYCQIFVR